MSRAKEFSLQLVSKVWLTPTVVSLGFQSKSALSYEPGQFLSVQIPTQGSSEKKWIKRAYSFSSSPEKSDRHCSLCVKVLSDGVGSQYLARLNVGDEIRVSAPYGNFKYQTPPDRRVCWVSTSTGVAPFLSMMNSSVYQEALPVSALHLMGAKNEEELILPGAFSEWGVREVACLTGSEQRGNLTRIKPPEFEVFRGRVTDYLRALPLSWSWAETDFYVCGNRAMVDEVEKILRERGVSAEHLFLEGYSSPKKDSKLAVGGLPRPEGMMPPPFIKPAKKRNAGGG